MVAFDTLREHRWSAIAGFVVAQSSKWSADFTAGRTGLILSAPVSWVRLFSMRVAVALLGVAAILAASLGVMVIVASSIDVGVDLDGLFRLTSSSLVLGLAMIALSAITTVLFTAFGNPYLEWPSLLESSIILALAGPGLLLAFVLVARSRKAP